MKTINKILAGIAAYAALTFGSANAQTITTETGLAKNDAVNGAAFQRIALSYNGTSFKYDKFLQPKDNEQFNVFHTVASDKTGNIDAGVMYIGPTKETFVDISGSKKFDNVKVSLELGHGWTEGPSRQFAISRTTLPHATVELATVSSKPINQDAQYNKYGWISLHDAHNYAAIGTEVDRTWGFWGIKGFDDFGTYTNAKYDRKTGDYKIKSQTAIDNVSQEFYSTEMFDIASNYFCVPPFFSKHLSPLVTKGNYTLKLEANVNGTTHDKELEVMVGKQTPIVDVGVGVNKLGSDKGIALELYKRIQMGKFEGSAEYRFNKRSKEHTGYVTMKYKM